MLAEEIEMTTIYSDTITYHSKVYGRKHRYSIIIGNLLEHFDSSLYGFLAPILGKLFFPNFSPLYQLILTYSVFAVTFIARPLGGVFFSKLTYRYGPLKTLSWTLIGVALATGLMGLIPGAEQIGVLAPILLVSTRFFQSFCAAGENTIAGYYLIEKCQKHQQVPLTSIYQSSTVLGILAASSLSALIVASPDYQNLWRIPFIIGFLVGLCGLWMRFQLKDDRPLSAFNITLTYGTFLKRIKANYKLIMCFIPIYGLSYLTYSFIFVFLNPYLPQISSLSLPSLMNQSSSLLWLDALIMPLVALTIRQLNWQRVMIGCALLFLVSTCALLGFFQGLSLMEVFIWRALMVIGGVGFSAALIPWAASIFPDQDKYLIHSISYAIGSETFGRTTPAICLWIYSLTNHPSSPLLYVAGVIFMTFCCFGYLYRTSENQSVGASQFSLDKL